MHGALRMKIDANGTKNARCEIIRNVMCVTSANGNSVIVCPIFAAACFIVGGGGGCEDEREKDGG